MYNVPFTLLNAQFISYNIKNVQYLQRVTLTNYNIDNAKFTMYNLLCTIYNLPYLQTRTLQMKYIKNAEFSMSTI